MSSPRHLSQQEAGKANHLQRVHAQLALSVDALVDAIASAHLQLYPRLWKRKANRGSTSSQYAIKPLCKADVILLRACLMTKP